MTLDAPGRCQFCRAATTQHDPLPDLCDRCDRVQVAAVRARLDHVSGTVWTGGPL